ncbi:hypothetical protein Poly59_11980 [Rubripirellula reticaptiva]|uniref:Uncharacterized protein n=1 Tax=Rubripirellula reticaptiva TaxID=2528013 RepID=A0A5C6FCD2_9BACT|nr:hypothetical protein Poly59_11980 [Rubripirellula reticaptiva]
MAATEDAETARVYHRENGSWERLTSAKEESDALLFNTSFTIIRDETPVVTWECFRPH